MTELYGNYKYLYLLQTILLDGGELNFGAGAFNGLVNVPNEQWDMMEKMIRESNAKQKAKPKL